MNRCAFLASTTLAVLLARAARAAGDDSVSVAYAGSLVTPMEKSIGPAFAATGHGYKGEGKGSTALANLIRDGLRTPDVFISADTAAIESLRGTAGHDAVKWYATFAATRLQIAYSAKGKFAADFAAAANGAKAWYDVLQQPGVVVARTDPAQDPKGYRVLLVMQLAQMFYKRPNLAAAVLGDERNPQQVLPEEDSFARLESGEVDAVWSYSTESTSRGLPAVDLPPQINLGDPKFADRYATASVTVGAKTYRGAPSVYALTIPVAAGNPAGGAAFVGFLLRSSGKSLLTQAGLTVLEPRVVGDKSAIAPELHTVLS